MWTWTKWNIILLDLVGLESILIAVPAVKMYEQLAPLLNSIYEINTIFEVAQLLDSIYQINQHL